MMINSIASLNTIFITMLMIISLTLLLYHIMGRMNKPIVLGGLIAGVILTNLHIPTRYFDLTSCSILGDLGVVIFMVITGVRFRFATFTERKNNLLIIIISACFTFVLGFACAHLLYPMNISSSAKLSEFQFAIILSVSLSTPAFTLVSLFLNQTHLLRLNISQVALLLSFCEDLIFWILLSFLLIANQTNQIVRVNEPFLIVCFLFISFFIARPLLKWIAAKIKSVQLMILFIIVGTFIFAVVADSIDLHQILGAFIFGLLLPRNNKLINKIVIPLEKVTLIFLLPIFFAQIGGITHLLVVHDIKLVWYAILLTFVALFSKFFGSLIGAKLIKYTTLEAGFLGGLLNLRGVFEVVFIKIAWEVGLISKDIFIILVIMAVVSTWFSTAIALWFRNQILKKHHSLNMMKV